MASDDPSGTNKGVVFVVEDDGEGISEEFLRHELFLPFRTTKTSGLGIGLFQLF